MLSYSDKISDESNLRKSMRKDIALHGGGRGGHEGDNDFSCSVARA